MNRNDEASGAIDYFKSCVDILVKKAHDYANDDDCFSNFKKVSMVCNVSVEKVFLMFLTLKITRLIELIEKGNTAVGESITDSLKDICNYSCIMSLFIKENK